jgi:mannitol 2-dehydrogenase
MPLIDPLGNKLRERARSGGKDPQNLLAMSEVFSDALAKSQVFVDQVGEALRSLYEEGARATLARYVQQESSRSEGSRTQG